MTIKANIFLRLYEAKVTGFIDGGHPQQAPPHFNLSVLAPGAECSGNQ